MTKRALLIGCSKFLHLKDLPGAAGDISSLKRVLEDPNLGNFNVETRPNLRWEEIRPTIAKFVEQCTADDTVYVHISTHGFEEGNHLYIAGTNTEKDDIFSTAIEARAIIEKLERCKATNKVVVFDCCYAGFAENGVDALSYADSAIVISASGGTIADGLTSSYLTTGIVKCLETIRTQNQVETIGITALFNSARGYVLKQDPKQDPRISQHKGRGDWEFSKIKSEAAGDASVGHRYVFVARQQMDDWTIQLWDSKDWSRCYEETVPVKPNRIPHLAGNLKYALQEAIGVELDGIAFGKPPLVEICVPRGHLFEQFYAAKPFSDQDSELDRWPYYLTINCQEWRDKIIQARQGQHGFNWDIKWLDDFESRTIDNKLVGATQCLVLSKKAERLHDSSEGMKIAKRIAEKGIRLVLWHFRDGKLTDEQIRQLKNVLERFNDKSEDVIRQLAGLKIDKEDTFDRVVLMADVVDLSKGYLDAVNGASFAGIRE